MAVISRYASFDLHIVGFSANDAARDEVTANNRGNAGTGTLFFTDPNRDFTADGVDTTFRIEIQEGGGNIQRDVAITAVSGSGNEILTVGGSNFNADENNLLYRVYKPPTAAQILSSPGLRGTGSAGWQEFLQGIDAEIDTNSASTNNLLDSSINVFFSEGLTQQVIVYEDRA